MSRLYSRLAVKKGQRIPFIRTDARTWLVLAAYGAAAVIMTWPVAARLGNEIPFSGGWDPYTHQWNFWWVKKALSEGIDPFFTHLLFHPVGVSLTSHNIAWLNILIWLPLQAVTGPLAAYSLVMMAMFALNGFATYLLVREWTGAEAAAFVGGLIYGFWPPITSNAGSPNLVTVFTIPLALLFLRRTLHHQRVRDALLAGVLVALAGIARWQVLIMATVVLGCYLVYEWLTNGESRSWRAMRLVALAGLLAALLMAPLLVPVIHEQVVGGYDEELLIDSTTTGQANLLAYLTPDLHQRFWRPLVTHLPESIQFNEERIGYLGYTTLVLVCLGVLKAWKKTRLWLGVAAIYFLLALGPELRLAKISIPQIPMPYRLFEDFFLLRLVRRPDRFNVLLGLPVSVLASFGVVAIIRRFRSTWQRWLLVAGVGGLVLAEFCLVPYPTRRLSTPPWYQQLAAEPGQFALLELPMNVWFHNKAYMFYQITHGKPIASGRVSRLPDKAFAFLDSTPFLKRLRKDNEMDPAMTDVTRQLRPLAGVDIRYLVLHKEFATEEQMVAWRSWLAYDPVHEDEQLAVYRTVPSLGSDFVLSQTFANGLGWIDTGVEPERVSQAGLITIYIAWATSQSPSADYQVCLALVDQDGQVAHQSCTPIDEVWPTGQWNPEEIVRGAYPVWIGPFLPAGSYQVTAQLAELGSNRLTGEPVRIGDIVVQPLPRVFAPPGGITEVDAEWQVPIRLLGYELDTTPAELALTLHWQADERPGKSYKVFVHLIEPTTGMIAAQQDAIPRQWTHPTLFWEAGEVIADAYRLPLEGVPAGHYQLLVGLYEEESGTRLPVATAEGQPYPDDAVLLTEVVR